MTGGDGKDFFVVHRRAAGSDVIGNFEAVRGEIVNLVRFGGKKFTDLRLTQEGEDVKVDLGDRQSVTLKKQTVAGLSAKNFNFQPTFVAPAAYTSSHTTMTQAQTGLGTVILKGGGDGIHFNLDAQGQMKFSLAGTIYSRDSAASDVFVVEAQRCVNDYQNALRGFRHGIDKIDLRQVGISDFSQLTIVKNNRATINGLSQIHGVDVMLKSADGADADVKLLYLDTLDVSQLDANDFLFAKPASALVSTVKPVVVLSPDKLTVIVQDPLTANTPEVDLTDSAQA